MQWWVSNIVLYCLRVLFFWFWFYEDVEVNICFIIRIWVIVLFLGMIFQYGEFNLIQFFEMCGECNMIMVLCRGWVLGCDYVVFISSNTLMII